MHGFLPYVLPTLSLREVTDVNKIVSELTKEGRGTGCSKYNDFTSEETGKNWKVFCGKWSNVGSLPFLKDFGLYSTRDNGTTTEAGIFGSDEVSH